MKRKQFDASFKATGEGTGRVVFATLNEIDKDGDITLPGAFGSQTAKLVAAHDWSAPSIGSAKISESGNEAIADIRFNLDMPSAKEWYDSMKFNFEQGITQEFSYGFDTQKYHFEERDSKTVRILEKQKVFEVSPVMIGAGNNTRTLNLKSGTMRMEDHWTFVEDAIEELLERQKALAVLRHKEGRTLSRATRDRLTRLESEIRLLLEETDKEPVETVIPEEDGKSHNLALLDIEIIEANLRRVLGGSASA